MAKKPSEEKMRQFREALKKKIRIFDVTPFKEEAKKEDKKENMEKKKDEDG